MVGHTDRLGRQGARASEMRMRGRTREPRTLLLSLKWAEDIGFRARGLRVVGVWLQQPIV